MCNFSWRHQYLWACARAVSSVHCGSCGSAALNRMPRLLSLSVWAPAPRIHSCPLCCPLLGGIPLSFWSHCCNSDLSKKQSYTTDVMRESRKGDTKKRRHDTQHTAAVESMLERRLVCTVLVQKTSKTSHIQHAGSLAGRWSLSKSFSASANTILREPLKHVRLIHTGRGIPQPSGASNKIEHKCIFHLVDRTW